MSPDACPFNLGVLMATTKTRRSGPNDPWGLSQTERQVVELLCKSGCNNEVAEQSGIAASTLAVHILRACHKAGVANRVLLLLEYDRWKRGEAA